MTLYLQLKPLYISGVILNDFGKYPYHRISKILNVSDKAVRYKLKKLKEIGLIHYDTNKNLCLHSYKSFYEYVTGQPYEYKKRIKCKYYQNKGINEILRIIAIQDNFKRQDFVIQNKSIKKHYGQTTEPDIVISKYAGNVVTKKVYSKFADRKRRILFFKRFDDHIETFTEEWKQEQLNKPLENSNFCPVNLISFEKLGQIYGVSKECAYYWFKKMQTLKLIEQEKNFIKDFTDGLEYAKNFLGLPGVLKNNYRFSSPQNQFKALLNSCSIKTLNGNELYI